MASFDVEKDTRDFVIRQVMRPVSAYIYEWPCRKSAETTREVGMLEMKMETTFKRIMAIKDRDRANVKKTQARSGGGRQRTWTSGSQTSVTQNKRHYFREEDDNDDDDDDDDYYDDENYNVHDGRPKKITDRRRQTTTTMKRLFAVPDTRLGGSSRSHTKKRYV